MYNKIAVTGKERELADVTERRNVETGYCVCKTPGAREARTGVSEVD